MLGERILVSSPLKNEYWAAQHWIDKAVINGEFIPIGKNTRIMYENVKNSKRVTSSNSMFNR